MDLAYDIKITGKPIKINAYELLEDSISSKANRFSCVICGEYVAYVHNKNGVKFFKHRKMDSKTIECENRINIGIEKYNFYEIKGAPLYLSNEKEGVFKLYISLSALGDSIHKHLKKYPAKMEICGTKTKMKKVDDTNFNINESTMIEVDFLPLNNIYNFDYQVTNDNTKKQLMKKWSDFSEFTYGTGAIFDYSEKGGRKVSKGGFLYSNTEYLYVTDKKIKSYIGLKIINQGTLKLEDKYFNVYLIIYEETDQSIISFSNDFCRVGLGLIYKTMKPQLIPLWPPAYRENDEYIAINNSKNFFFTMKLYDNNISLYKSTDKSTEVIDLIEISKESYLCKIPINKYSTSICIDSHTRQQEISINNKIKEIIYFKPNIDFFYKGKKSNILRCYEGYNIMSNFDIQLLSIKNSSKSMKIHNNRGGNLIFSESLDLWARANKFYFRVGTILEIEKKSTFPVTYDYELYELLRKNENTRLEFFYNINRFLPDLQKYPISYKYIKSLHSNGKLPVGIKKIIINLGGE